MVDAGQFEHQIQVGPNRVDGEPVELSFPRYWKGYIVGTNRVEVAARLERDGEINFPKGVQPFSTELWVRSRSGPSVV